MIAHLQLVCKQTLTILSFDTVLKLDPFHELCNWITQRIEHNHNDLQIYLEQNYYWYT